MISLICSMCCEFGVLQNPSEAFFGWVGWVGGLGGWVGDHGFSLVSASLDFASLVGWWGRFFGLRDPNG